LEIYFLGTGAGMPSRDRNVTSIALKLFEERGTFWLFDCGEGTQHQILRSPLKLSKLEKVFITHLHGDHLYGLPGLLTSRSHQGVTTPLTLYGPKGIRNFVQSALSVSQAHLDYELTIEEINEGRIFQDHQFIVEVAKVDHRVDSFGYRLTEQEQAGRLRVELLNEKGVSPGPVYAEIKRGIDVTLDNGELLKAADYMEEPTPGRIVAIVGDTRICESSKKLAENADVLVHEATFAGDLKDLAYQYYHTTSIEIAELAKECGVSALIMTHLSARYDAKGADQLLNEARQIFPNSYVAKDFWSHVVPRKNLA
jgi:ribonuclease Z